MKYTISGTCPDCGADTSYRKDLFGPIKQRENRVEYLEMNPRYCTDCYRKRAQAEAEVKGLILTISLNPFTVDTPILLAYDGNTLPNKDAIKSQGFIWGDVDAAGVFGALSTQKPKKGWSKYITITELDSVIDAAKELGAEIQNNIIAADIAALNYVQAQKDKKSAEIRARIEELVKPECPPVLHGVKWNKKVYGKKGYYNIYNNGVKTELSDEEAQKVSDYVADCAAYNRAVDLIKSQV